MTSIRPLRAWSTRARLTLLYGALFLVSGAALLAITYVLVDQTTYSETVTFVYPDGETRTETVDLREQDGEEIVGPAVAHARYQHAERLTTLLGISGIALGAMALVSVLLGWLMAGRVLLPLDAAFRAERRFVANASHELRTPLARARAIAQVALDDPDATVGTLREAHERVLAAGEQQEHIIDALLTLARGQAGAIRSGVVDLRALAASAIDQRRPDADRMGLAVRTGLEPVEVIGDPRLLAQLVGNLVDNAVRHNYPGGFIDVVTNSTPMPGLTVTNSSPEVPADRIPELTEPFRRLDAHRSASGDGNGLGLSIVKAVAEAHRAALTITPHDDGGLRVEVRFGG